VDWIYAVLLAGAIAVLVAAEWPRLAARFGLDDRAPRESRRRRKKTHLQLVENETDEFAASVQRDLERLPTIDERDR
jgi:hypothetical protein